MTRYLALAALLLLIAVSWWRILAADDGLLRRTLDRDGVPLTYMARQGATNAPGVVIAHGFAGSQQVMLAYAHVLAHSGYAVMLADFGGHGASHGVLDRGGLDADLDAAYAALIQQPEVDPARVALLGHSMGSGAVMSSALAAPNRYAAVVAISPTGAAVTPQAPANLMLQAGSLEANFLANAQRLLAQAGGAGGDVAAGTGRALVVVPLAEHISILFRDESHRAARDWLDMTFGRRSDDSYVDRRIVWYLVQLLAWLGVWALVVPLLGWGRGDPPLGIAGHAGPREGLGLVVAPVAATLALTLLGRWVALQDLGGLLVGAVVAVWLAVAGVTWLLVGGLPRQLARAPQDRGRLDARSLGIGLAMFALLWVALGAAGQVMWLQWLLVPARLLRWPLLAALVLPWFLAGATAQFGSSPLRQVLWWLATSMAVVVGLLGLIRLEPSVSFLALLAPVIPLAQGLVAFAGGRLHRPWAFAVGGALFFGWLIAAIFPLA